MARLPFFERADKNQGGMTDRACCFCRLRQWSQATVVRAFGLYLRTPILPSQTDFERYPSFQFCDQAEPFLHGWVCSEVWQRAYKPPRLSWIQENRLLYELIVPGRTIDLANHCRVTRVRQTPFFVFKPSVFHENLSKPSQYFFGDIASNYLDR
jgi:hypothetical protein